MEHVLLAQFTTALLLLLATPVVLRRGLPSTRPFSQWFSSLMKSVRTERKARRRSHAAMRGARPWWE